MESRVDFKMLAEKMSNPDVSIEDKSILFKAFLELQEWVLIIPKGKSLENAQPAIEIIDSKSWLLVFTDSSMALEFAKLNHEKYLMDSGDILFISLKVKDALKMIYDLNQQGIFGLQINFGLPGWYIPISSFPNIITFLKLDL
jgi:hypothetical protein